MAKTKTNTLVDENNFGANVNRSNVSPITPIAPFIPAEIQNADVNVTFNLNEFLQQYPQSIANSILYGFCLGGYLNRSMKSENILPENGQRQITYAPDPQSSNFGEQRSYKIIGVADRYSYAAYTSNEDYEKGLQFFDPATLHSQDFANVDQALSWAYNECCAMNPKKRFPLVNRSNWRIMVKNIEDKGNGQ